MQAKRDIMILRWSYQDERLLCLEEVDGAGLLLNDHRVRSSGLDELTLGPLAAFPGGIGRGLGILGSGRFDLIDRLLLGRGLGLGLRVLK